jgi:hypothetical protein
MTLEPLGSTYAVCCWDDELWPCVTISLTAAERAIERMKRIARIHRARTHGHRYLVGEVNAEVITMVDGDVTGEITL